MLVPQQNLKTERQDEKHEEEEGTQEER